MDLFCGRVRGGSREAGCETSLQKEGNSGCAGASADRFTGPEGVSPGHVENRPGCEFLCHGDHVTLGNSLNYSEPVLCRE